MDTPQTRLIRGFAVLPAYAWAARELVAGWRLWVPIMLVVCLLAAALPLLGGIFTPVLLAVAVQHSANPNLELGQVTYSSCFRVIVMAAVFAGFTAIYALMTFGIFLAVGLRDFPASSPSNVAYGLLEPELFLLYFAVGLFAVVLALCAFIFTFAADERFTLTEAATLGLAASAKNLDKVLLALLIAVISFAVGVYLRTLIPGEAARLSAIIWVPIIAFVSLAFAHGYRQVAAQVAPQPRH